MTTAGNNTSQHIRAAEQLGGKLNMTPAQLLANTVAQIVCPSTQSRS